MRLLMPTTAYSYDTSGRSEDQWHERESVAVRRQGLDTPETSRSPPPAVSERYRSQSCPLIHGPLAAEIRWASYLLVMKGSRFESGRRLSRERADLLGFRVVATPAVARRMRDGSTRGSTRRPPTAVARHSSPIPNRRTARTRSAHLSSEWINFESALWRPVQDVRERADIYRFLTSATEQVCAAGMLPRPREELAPFGARVEVMRVGGKQPPRSRYSSL
jgi:hypothetical protein